MSSVEQDTVAIFWDYENCEMPASADPFTISNGIRRLSQGYGIVKVFRAYFEMSDLTSQRSISMRSGLQSCGVSLIDCPHNNRKDVADKMILADMLVHAMDHPAPSTVILISGDRDFAYAVSLLRLRKYKIVVIAPSTLHNSLKTQATTAYEWPRSVLEFNNNGCDLGLPWPARGRVVNASDVRTNLPVLIQGTQFVSEGPIPPNPRSPVFPRPDINCAVKGPVTPVRSDTIRHSRSPSLGVLSEKTTSGRALTTPSKPSFADAVSGGSAASIQTSLQDNNCNLSPVWRPMPVQAAAAPTSVTTDSSLTIFDEKQHSLGSPFSESKQPGESRDDDDFKIALNDEHLVPDLKAMDTQDGRHSDYSQESLEQGSPEFTFLSSPLALAGAERGSISSDISVMSPLAGIERDFVPTLQDPTGLAVHDSIQLNPDIVIPTVAMARLRRPPSKFKLLVRVLERERLRGNTRVVFSQLGSMLRAEHPSVYQRAGAAQLKDYIAMAEQDGVVIVGSSRCDWENGNKWTALHPVFHGKPQELLAQPQVVLSSL
ncbi:hypothetical protein PHLCEN_2v5037 [Hermanssonia centrifuga]|uniref:NYN domain-containing protein n=1 Tax=Hermanssonia centrifuga TaxID=98765 RepID=A0A2R6PC69_9APHY|nr:hypothetical protein PHLCEN_2v5037 [Hermanssonia centrifuga]